MAVDLPQMEAGFLRRLAGQCGPATGVVPELNGRLEPLCAIYPKRSHAAAAGAIARGEHSAGDFARACLEDGRVRVMCVAPDDAQCFANWNSPSDLYVQVCERTLS
jgi:molybdopterin-guanine dinucleotide biosynthesis protein A